MSEMVQSFHQSPQSHHQMHSHIQRSVLDVESKCNWSFESDVTSTGFFNVSDCFQRPELAGSPFTNFTSSSVDELSKVTATIHENQSLRKRKLEFSLSFGKDYHKQGAAECDSGLIGPVKSRKSIPNGNLKPKMDPKTYYIHVRARHGQATDSHSLAERARREKLKKKMQYLQDLVPGCNKLTNRAAVLDEIITYVQCLQSDVELLTMKLAASTKTVDLSIDNSLPKRW